MTERIPSTYAIAMAQAFVRHNYMLRTGWHTRTKARCEPQKATMDLRGAGVPVTCFCARRGVWRYIVQAGYARRLCRKIAAKG